MKDPDVSFKYSEQSITRTQLSQSKGWILLEFGENWCSICQTAQPLICNALSTYPNIKRLMVLDGKAKRLGREFKVTLWPTLFLLYNGGLKGELVRPESLQQLSHWLNKTVLD